MSTAPPRPAFLGALRPWLAGCEARLGAVVAGFGAAVGAPAADTLAAGGKRVRPMLVFASAARRPADRDALTSAATAVELIHMATLVHDDLIDDATTRRGRPTVARARGPEAAVRVGDFLFARAFAELTRIGSPDAVRALARAALDLSSGEMAQQGAAFDLGLSEAAYLDRCRRKTAALFSVSCRLGGMVSDAGAETQERLAAFGAHVGLAFQIFDDILDLTGSAAATGKRRGIDIRSGTITLPVILALRDDPELAFAIRAAEGDGAAVEGLCDLLAAHRGVALARERALDYVRLAREAVDAPLDGADADALIEIADGVVDRYA